jgi:cytochrome c oxidase assembly protein subunit 15
VSASVVGRSGTLDRPLTRLFRYAAWAALFALFLVTVTGATVRLTGSGLGCENWPRCGEQVLPEAEAGYHAYVEFGNRVVGFAVGLTTLAAAVIGWRARVPRLLFRLALSLPFLVLAQGVLGGITVLVELNPVIVMSHFLLSLVGVGLGVVLVLETERWVRGSPAPEEPRELRWFAFGLVPLTLALVVSGTFATAAGPHSGGVEIDRLWVLVDAVHVHVRVTAAFGIAYLVFCALLVRARAWRKPEGVLTAITLGLLVAQMIVGETQYREQLPWWLVLVHVTLATLVWAGVVAVAALLRPRSPASPA